MMNKRLFFMYGTAFIIFVLTLSIGKISFEESLKHPTFSSNALVLSPNVVKAAGIEKNAPMNLEITDLISYMRNLTSEGK